MVHPPVHYDATENAWMTAALFKWWFYHCFVPEVKAHLHQQPLPEDSKVILLLDNCRAHPPAHELVSGNIFAAFFPPNVTSLIQPMDQGIISNSKHIYKSAFLCQLVNTDMNVPESQKSFDLNDAICAVALTWKDVKDTTLRNRWHKLWPTVATEDFDFEGFDDLMTSQPTTFRGCSNWPHKLLHLIPSEMWTLPGWRSGSVGRMERRLSRS